MQQIFTDGIGKISVIGGVVRLDFVVYSLTDADVQGQPRHMLTHQVLMGVEAFMRAAAQCSEAAKQLKAAAQPAPVAPPASKPAPPAPETPAAPAAPAAAPPRKADASPWTANLKPVAPMRPFP